MCIRDRGKLLRVAVMHRVTDMFGPIPYSKVVDKLGGISLSVPYDSQEEVYKQMLKELNEVTDVLKENLDLDPETVSYTHLDVYKRQDTLNPIYYKEAQLIIKLVLERLPEQRRMIFEMSRFKHMSNLEIAEKLNISKRTVEHHIYLTLLEMKKII